MSSKMLTTFYFKAEFNLRPTSLPLTLSSKTDLLNLYTDDARLPLHRLPCTPWYLSVPLVSQRLLNYLGIRCSTYIV